MEEIYNKLLNKIPKEQIYLNEPMSKHTTFRIGGTADVFIKVNTLEELKFILNVAKDVKMPITVIGNGSNILVRDGRDKRNNT